MLSRRRFLNVSGLGVSGLGILAAGAACRPPVVVAAADRDAGNDRRLRIKESQKHLKDNLLGYPINMREPSPAFVSWRQELFRAGIDQFAFNNVGNPFQASPIPYNTHDFERDTIASFSQRFRFPDDDYWGFISHSGTDSNMHGMYMGRTLLKGRTGVLPKAYFTREAHYSVQILRDLLGLETEFVGTLPDGSMDADDLKRRLSENREYPALVVATIGTTFKGAVDQLDQIRTALQGHPSYVHLDAALFGGYLSYTKHASEVFHSAGPALPSGRYDSIAVSCHKFFGFPSPAGIFISRRGMYDEFNRLFSRIHNPEYIHHVPGTITCSRDAVKPAEFYYFTRPSVAEELSIDADAMLENATYLKEQMQQHFPQMQPTRSNPLSNTIYFRDPGKALVHKYSLATMELDVDGQSERFAHVVVMPHVSRRVLDMFLEDLEHARPS